MFSYDQIKYALDTLDCFKKEYFFSIFKLQTPFVNCLLKIYEKLFSYIMFQFSFEFIYSVDFIILAKKLFIMARNFLIQLRSLKNVTKRPPD